MSTSTESSARKARIMDITPERDKGVMKEIQRQGTGDGHPLMGDTALIHYVGRLQDGTEFDSSRKSEAKFQIKLDSDDASILKLKAWELGIPTMKRGEVAVFDCQPKYAHGKKGLPPKVPPNTPVIYEIEVFSWWGEDVSEGKDGGVLKSRMKNGHGVNPPKDGAACTVRLIGRYDGKEFLDRHTKFILGEGCDIHIVEGVEQGLRAMKHGERSLLKIKARYAYGADGFKASVPPDADVEFDVELEAYDPHKEGWMLDDDERMSAASVAKLKGLKRYEEGKYRFAARHFSSVVDYLREEDTLVGEEKRKRDGLMLSAYLNSAMCQLKLGNNLEVVHSCERALEMEPRNEKALYRRATAHMNMSNYDSALEDYQTLLSINASNSLVQDQIAVANQKRAEMTQREKIIYSHMFDKKSRHEATHCEQTTHDEASCDKADDDPSSDEDDCLQLIRRTTRSVVEL